MLRADIAETRLEPNSQMYAVIIGYMARVGTETPDSMQRNSARRFHAVQYI